VNRTGPSTKTATNSTPQTDEGDGEDEDGDGSEGTEVKGTKVKGKGGSSTSSHCMKSFEDIEADDNNSDMDRSDIVLTPPISDEDDGGISSHLNVEFHEADLPNPILKLKMKFSSIQLFREAIR